MRKDHYYLSIIVLVALLVRIGFLCWGRPVFVGWFNHTYYYYVEVKGLLLQGAMPYADMPLLFYLYAATAELLSWFGLSTELAIVVASRAWMCLIPALMPIPIYWLFRRITAKGPPLASNLWVLVAASAFLPLSLLHLPEFSQKNVLGLLLLTFWVGSVQQNLRHSSRRRQLELGLLLLAIVLTHFGTTAATLLYAVAVAAALFLTRKQGLPIARLLLSGLGATLLVLLLIWWIDAARFERIFFYLGQSLNSSFLGQIFAVGSTVADRLMALVGLFLPLTIGWLLFRDYRRRKAKLPSWSSTFYLSQIIWCYLLVLPIYDQLLLARLLQFAYLPALLIMAYWLVDGNVRNWMKKTMMLVISLGCLALAFGEFMGRMLQNPNAAAIHADLQQLQREVELGPDDLIVTKNGAEHICNWFLGTKAGTITALQLDDFDRYERIFVLNPIEGSLNYRDLAGRRATNEADRYLFMLRNIPPPATAIAVYQSDYMQFFVLPQVPPEWEFNASGDWISYGSTIIPND